MAVTSKMFGQAVIKAFNKEVKWAASGGDTFKVALYTGTIPSTAQDNWIYKSDIATIVEVASGNGYITGGQSLSSLTVSYDSSTNTVKFTANNVVWSASTITADCALIIDDTGVAGTSVLLGYIDFGGTKSSSNGNFQITWDSNGIFTIETT